MVTIKINSMENINVPFEEYQHNPVGYSVTLKENGVETKVYASAIQIQNPLEMRKLFNK